jgi:acetyl esterase/lipase
MAGLFAFLRYLRLKLLISFYRLIVKIFASPRKPRPDAVLRIPSRDPSRTIKAHVYNERGGSIGPRPVLLNFCGSGFTIPLHGADDNFCWFVAKHTKESWWVKKNTSYIVLDIEYRLAPEHPFPAAVHDMEDAVKYVLSRPEEYTTAEISVSGFSSGGTLALVAPTLFPPGTFQSVIAFYPATDLATDPSMRKPPAPNAKPRSAFWTRVFREAYIGDMDPRDPRISPLYADTSRFPDNMFFITAELDSSALEAEELAQKAKVEGIASGRSVGVRRIKDCGHAFDKKNTDLWCVLAANAAYGAVVTLLKEVAGESYEWSWLRRR